MRPKSIALLLLACACGLVAAFGLSEIINSQSASAGAVETEPILVAKLDIDRNAVLSSENLKIEEWPKDKVPEGSVREISEVEGRRPVIKINEGLPILQSMLGSGSRATDDIPSGFRVSTVRVTDEDGANLIRPGDRVDVQVFARRNPGAGIKTTGTWTFLQDVSVFAVNELYREEGDNPDTVQARTVSLLVTPKQAAKVTVAAKSGEIRLVLRGGQDDKEQEDYEATMAEVLGETEKFGGESSTTPSTSDLAANFKSEMFEWLKEQQSMMKPAAVGFPQASGNGWKMVVGAGSDWRVEEFRSGELLPASSGFIAPGEFPDATQTQDQDLDGEVRGDRGDDDSTEVIGG